MNSVIDRYRRQRVPSPSHCEPKPQPCSTCGMLECLCRPRFFAGQILTADDLNRLDYYMRAKHRLHNRQLHGWGVVNGLEVTCDVCGPGVVVGCGYALSPCGDDIVVCEPVVVDVCALIKECKGTERAEPCEPPRPPSPAGCEQGEEEWILAIRYSEAPTRAVKPLMPGSADSCGCTWSGKGGCSCDGGVRCTCGKPQAKPRAAPVQCEPTVVCEGFEFAVYRKPPEPDDTGDDRRLRLNPDSEIVKRFECCTEVLVKGMPKMPGQPSLQNVQQNLAAWHDWMCRFKDYLHSYLSSKPGYNCELLARLNAVVCPPLTGNNAAALILQTIVLLLVVWLDALLACFCSALLPPCPTAHASDLVPLASIRVSADPCRVLSICNWTRHRKFATTFPALQYWLSILPFGVELRRMLEQTCCFQIASILPPRQPETPGVAADVQPGAFAASEFFSAQPRYYERAGRRLNPMAANPDRLKAASALAGKAFARGKTPLDPQRFIESVFLPDQDKGAEHLSALELINLPQFLAVNQVLRPVAAEALSLDALAPLLAAFTGGPPRAEPAVDQLKEELAALRQDMARQAEEIKRLKEAGRRKKEK